MTILLANAITPILGAAVADTHLSPVAVAAVARPAAPAATSIYASFETFRIIEDRNIFDPNRVGRTLRPAEDQRPRGDTISLVGTLQSEKGLFAFFDGSNASFQKALRVGERIAQYTVARIGHDSVDLTRDDRTLSLTIGRQLQRPVGGDWSVAEADAVRSDATVEVTAVHTISADASDTLKRLMKKRQNQLKP